MLAKNLVIRKKLEKISLASFKSLKKEVGSGVVSGSISQRYGSADPDPDPHRKVMDPQHCIFDIL
jgi:hypothetical protein